LSIAEVALISGHKDPRMLFRYTHLRAEDIAKKLQKSGPMCWELDPQGSCKPAFQK
jgi:hypothetical protein